MIRQQGAHPIEINGPEDHLHVVLSIPPTLAVAKSIQDLKSNCTDWIHHTFAELKDFRWQDGYASFTVSPSVLPSVIKYVQGQQEHHKRVSYRDELIWLLKNHEIEFDEKYIQ
jgi:putative transposase